MSTLGETGMRGQPLNVFEESARSGQRFAGPQRIGRTVAGSIFLVPARFAVCPPRVAFAMLADLGKSAAGCNVASQSTITHHYAGQGNLSAHARHTAMAIGSLFAKPLWDQRSVFAELVRYIEESGDATGLESLFLTSWQSVWMTLDMVELRRIANLWNESVRNGDLAKQHGVFVIDRISDDLFILLPELVARDGNVLLQVDPWDASRVGGRGQRGVGGQRGSFDNFGAGELEALLRALGLGGRGGLDASGGIDWRSLLGGIEQGGVGQGGVGQGGIDWRSLLGGIGQGGIGQGGIGQGGIGQGGFGGQLGPLGAVINNVVSRMGKWGDAIKDIGKGVQELGKAEILLGTAIGTVGGQPTIGLAAAVQGFGGVAYGTAIVVAGGLVGVIEGSGSGSGSGGGGTASGSGSGGPTSGSGSGPGSGSGAVSGSGSGSGSASGSGSGSGEGTGSGSGSGSGGSSGSGSGGKPNPNDYPAPDDPAGMTSYYPKPDDWMPNPDDPDGGGGPASAGVREVASVALVGGGMLGFVIETNIGSLRIPGAFSTLDRVGASHNYLAALILASAR